MLKKYVDKIPENKTVASQTVFSKELHLQLSSSDHEKKLLNLRYHISQYIQNISIIKGTKFALRMYLFFFSIHAFIHRKIKRTSGHTVNKFLGCMF